jgi:hypothetical protein
MDHPGVPVSRSSAVPENRQVTAHGWVFGTHRAGGDDVGAQVGVRQRRLGDAPDRRDIAHARERLPAGPLSERVRDPRSGRVSWFHGWPAEPHFMGRACGPVVLVRSGRRS